MPFKIKDLLIDIETAEAVGDGRYPCLEPTKALCREPSSFCPLRTCEARTRPCDARTYTIWTCGYRSPCPARTFPGCPGRTRYTYEEEDWWTPVAEGEIGELRQEDLGALKQRLEQALDVVKVKHAELEAGGVREPKTHEEIDALESKLEDALKELRARKAKLR